MDRKELRETIATLLQAKRPDLAMQYASAMLVTAGKKVVFFLGNIGPNNAPEWVAVWYRDLNGDGTGPVMRITPRLGIEPDVTMLGREQFYGDVAAIRKYLQNMRHKLSRQGVILLNRLSSQR